MNVRKIIYLNCGERYEDTQIKQLWNVLSTLTCCAKCCDRLAGPSDNDTQNVATRRLNRVTKRVQHLCCWLRFEICQIFHATFVNAAWCCTRFGHLYSWNTSSTCNIQHVATRRNWETKCAQKSCAMLRRSDRLATCFGALGAEVLKRVDSRFFRTSLAPNCTSRLMKISGHLPPSNIKFLQQRATLG